MHRALRPIISNNINSKSFYKLGKGFFTFYYYYYLYYIKSLND